jgi:hypothetical protein
VEECFGVDVRCVQRRFGKEVLLRAIRRCEPVFIPIPYNRPFAVWLTYDTHPLVGKPGKWSSLEEGTARIRFCCPGCRRKVLKLFYYLYPGSTLASDLRCRCCHNLTYLSVNCAGNRFYQRVVKPYRHLQLLKERLRAPALPQTARRAVETNVALLEDQLRQALKRYGRRPRSGHAEGQAPRRAQLSAKRAYKSLGWA